MIISNLELLNFRNYPKLLVIFTSGLNVIVGKNGVGKTNIVEAIDLFGFARSFRTNDAKALIRHGEQKAIITAIVHIPSRTEICIEISPKSKKVSVNGKTLPKLSQLSRYVSATTFEPEDVLFFDDAPSRRRKYLDTNLVRQDEVYLQAMSRYEKLLRERNALLKTEDNGSMLEIINGPFLNEAALIVEKRTSYMKDVARVTNEILRKLSKDALNLGLSYHSSLGTSAHIRQNGKYELNRVKEKEKVLQTTVSGPHRDDIIATLNGKGLKDHASQGQKRLVAIALTLAPYYLEKEEHKKPVIILDDVLSELDEGHQERLLDILRTCKQVFITTTQFNNHAHAIYEVNEQKEIRRINE